MNRTVHTSIILITFVFAQFSIAAVTIPTVPVGNAGNTADLETGFGAVSYDYRMGTTEVTVGQYAAFLNAVAADDQVLLWNPWMEPSFVDPIGTIARNGTPGSYTYSVLGAANHPITYVDWGDAARFANWLHNGQPTGPQDSSTTEDGAYSMIGSLNLISRNPGATWFLPSESEWYKAAYHRNDGPTGNYWDYPTASDTAPLAEAPPGGANSANYDNVVPSSFFDLGMTDVGSYLDTPSPYGTFDQAGNLIEWTEGIELMEWNEEIESFESSGVFLRGRRGGAWSTSSHTLLASNESIGNDPTLRGTDTGFRVATVPEPSTWVLTAGAILALSLAWRRRA